MSRPAILSAISSALFFAYIATCAAAPACAQAQTASHLRAVAVYEYVGSMEKPARSRLVPVCIWDGMQFQPARLYLADPEPLAVESGTLYELMRDGIGIGQIEVNQAEEAASGWIGLGRYLPNPKPQPVKLKLPSYLTESKKFESDVPHFAYTPPKATGVAGEIPPSTASNTGGGPVPHTGETPAEEGRPTLNTAESEPPTLHRPALTVQSSSSMLNARTAPPARPRLFYGKPKHLQSSEKQDVLTGLPPQMQQVVAVSDPAGTENHSYAWNWSSAEEKTQAETAMEALARHLLSAQTGVQSQGPILLRSEHFRAFQLAWGSGAVYVFSARTSGTADQTRYITLIARPDFSGGLVTLYQHITSDALLDFEPRLRLIDAVDATGNGQADLLFDLITRRARQFALFRVGLTQAWEVFTTAPQ